MNWDSLERQLSTQLAHIRFDIDLHNKGQVAMAERMLESLVTWSQLPGSRLRQLDIRLCNAKAWRGDRPRHLADECDKYVQLLARICGSGKDMGNEPRRVLGRQVKKKLLSHGILPNLSMLMGPGMMLQGLHDALGGELWVDDVLCYEDGVKVEEGVLQHDGY
jgi:hypothetical protein